MATLFKLPLLGQTMQEGTILKWYKQEGDAVQGWETLFEVMTDKVNMEVDPQVSGVLRKILAPEGATVPVGAPVAIIGAPDEPIDDLLAQAASGGAPGARLQAPGSGNGGDRPPATSEANRTSTQPGAWSLAPGAASEASMEPPAVSPRARARAEEAGLDWRSLAGPGSGFEGMIVERDVEALLARMPAAPRLTPLAAKLAAELGVPAHQITGTGPAGKVTADDVRRAASAPARDLSLPPQAAVPPSPTREGERIDREAAVSRGREPWEVRLTGVRKVIAERLAAISRAAPHVPLRAEIDMTDASALRAQLLPEIEHRAGVRLTITDLIAAATIVALRDHPRLNATLEEDLLRLYPAVHLGLAVALEDGLVVPVLRDADQLSLDQLAARSRAAADRARGGALKPDELSGGTFTITNLGTYGVDSFDPILNPPQVAILGVGRIAPRVVPHGEGTAVRSTMCATLVFDHRALDGAPAAQFLARLKELLEAPYRLLLG